MAQISMHGFGELDAMFEHAAQLPDEIVTRTLDAMAAEAEKHVKQSGEAMGVRDPESQVHILDHITHTRPKRTDSGGYCAVTFSGGRTRGKTRTQNSEIAFVNEYGKRGQPARPFIAKAAETGAGAIAAAGEKILGDWFEKNTK